jgi:hypothetical protein
MFMMLLSLQENGVHISTRVHGGGEGEGKSEKEM